MLKSYLKIIASIVGGSIAVSSAGSQLVDILHDAASGIQHQIAAAQVQEQPVKLEAAEDDPIHSQENKVENSQSKDASETSVPVEAAPALSNEDSAVKIQDLATNNNSEQNDQSGQSSSSTPSASSSSQSQQTAEVYEAEEPEQTWTYEEPQTRSDEPAAVLPSHQIHTGFITPELTGLYTQRFLQDIREGASRLYYDGLSADADFSLSEIVSFYCSMPDGIRYFETTDSTGTYLELEEPERAMLQRKVAEADQGWASYAAYIANTAATLDLQADDAALVDEINEFICRNYDYEVTNSGMPKFLSTHRGQCWHYAKMFADLCNTVGIPAWKVENDTHAWNQVVVNGQTYTFDPTFNDTSGDWTRYSWQLS